jgi:hypothetical protein
MKREPKRVLLPARFDLFRRGGDNTALIAMAAHHSEPTDNAAPNSISASRLLDKMLF